MTEDPTALRQKKEADQKEAVYRALSENEGFLRHFIKPLQDKAKNKLDEAVKMALGKGACGNPATSGEVAALIREYHAFESVASDIPTYLGSLANARKNKS